MRHSSSIDSGAASPGTSIAKLMAAAEAGEAAAQALVRWLRGPEIKQNRGISMKVAEAKVEVPKAVGANRTAQRLVMVGLSPFAVRV